MVRKRDFPSGVWVNVWMLQNSAAFSPQANYTDWATVTGRRILVPIFVERGVSRGQRGGNPMADNLSSLDRSPYFLFQAAPHLSYTVAMWEYSTFDCGIFGRGKAY
jgi:hypothetical protein